MGITDPKPTLIAEDGLIKAYAHDKDGLFKPHSFAGGVIIPPPSNGEVPEGEVVYVKPQWVVGVLDPDKGHRNPSVGSGEGAELIAWYTREEFSNAVRINLSIWLFKNGGDNGVTSGSYEMILPEEITPSLDWYAQSFNIWMSGSGQKEYTGTAKWHVTDKTENPMRIIFTIGGVEWSPTEPRSYGSQCKLRLTGFEYLL